MGPFTASVLLSLAAPAASVGAPAFTPTRAVASAQASVRILPGAKVSLSARAETEGHKLTKATITAEGGSRRSAKLVEFQ